MLLLLENKIKGGMSSVMGDRFVQSVDNKTIFYVDAYNFYGWAMSEKLLYDEIKFDRNVELEGILNTPNDSKIGYFIGVELNNPDKIKYKQKIFQLLLKIEKVVLMTLVII